MMELTAEKVGDVLVVGIPSDHLDASNAKEFKRAMAPLLRENTRIAFDMDELSFVDSSGLVAILGCLREVNANEGDVKLFSMAKPVRALFELVRMHRIIDILETRDEALRAFQAAP